jgi:hypothetical protein
MISLKTNKKRRISASDCRQNDCIEGEACFQAERLVSPTERSSDLREKGAPPLNGLRSDAALAIPRKSVRSVQSVLPLLGVNWAPPNASVSLCSVGKARSGCRKRASPPSSYFVCTLRRISASSSFQSKPTRTAALSTWRRVCPKVTIRSFLPFRWITLQSITHLVIISFLPFPPFSIYQSFPV